MKLEKRAVVGDCNSPNTTTLDNANNDYYWLHKIPLADHELHAFFRDVLGGLCTYDTTPYGLLPVSVSEDFIVTTTVYRSLHVLHRIEKAPNGSRHITFGHIPDVHEF